MLISDKAIRKLQILECTVNEGSPNRVTFAHSASPWFDPRYARKIVSLPILEPLDDTTIWTDDSRGEFLSLEIPPHGIIVHPDTLPFFQSRHVPGFRRTILSIEASPTASPRVFLVYKNKRPVGFVKLSYPLKLGRFPARLTHKAIERSIPVSRLLNKILLSKESPSGSAWWPETAFRYADLYNSSQENGVAGMIWRPLNITSNVESGVVNSLTPLFSLQSYRIRNCYLEPYVRHWNKGDERSILDSIWQLVIEPIVRLSIEFAKRFGVIFELHAQNILVGQYLGNDKRKESLIVYRDALGLTLDLSRFPWTSGLELSGGKDVEANDNHGILKKRSVSLDHMLWSYCVLPLLEASRNAGADDVELLIRTRRVFNELCPEGFLPNGQWWRRSLNSLKEGQWLSDELVSGVPPLRDSC